MTDYTTCSAGIDVAKAKLDIALHPGGQHLVVDYTTEGLKTLDRFLRQHGVARVGFEASGGYEWRLLAHLRKGSIPAARFQPVQVRAFAKSRLQRAKNDKLDALLIAAFTASLPEMPPLPDARLDGLADHLTYIEQFEERIATLKTMLEACRDPRIRRLQTADIKKLQAARKAEVQLLVKMIASHAELNRKFRLIVSIKGVGERSALAFVVRLPEIGSLSREEAAALAGVAPFDNDSGTRNRTRRVAGGRQEDVSGSAKASSWQPSQQLNGTRISKPSTHACVKMENPTSSPQSQLPENLSSSQTQSSRKTSHGVKLKCQTEHGCSHGPRATGEGDNI